MPELLHRLCTRTRAGAWSCNDMLCMLGITQPVCAYVCSVLLNNELASPRYASNMFGTAAQSCKRQQTVIKQVQGCLTGIRGRRLQLPHKCGVVLPMIAPSLGGCTRHGTVSSPALYRAATCMHDLLQAVRREAYVSRICRPPEPSHPFRAHLQK